LNEYRKDLLPNGIKVISEKIPHLKSFSLGFWFNVGSRDESRANNGISHFTEHMLFKGTKNRSARKIANDIEAYGGYLNAFTSKEHTCYYGRGMGKHLKRTFEVLADMALNPAFKESEIKKEAGVIIDELNDIEDSPEELIFDKFEEALFVGNALSYPIIGNEENILSFSQKNFFEFIGEKYNFKNLTIAACGDVNHDELAEYAVKYFGRGKASSPSIRKSAHPKKSIETEIEKDIQQTHVIVGVPTYGYKDKRRNLVNLFSHILGEGSSSRLFQTVREKNGITYQLNSFLNSFYDVSVFGVYYSTNDKSYEKAQKLIFNEFEKLKKTKVGKTELARAKEYFKGSLYLSLESATNRMFRIAQNEIYFDKNRTVDEVISQIDAITSEDILEIANELLDEKTLSKITLKAKNNSIKSAA
jgi:predicted Zn-dependent peptidase